jgi:prepilin-type N-terminal cleavage/methylation domain-containing protein
MKQSMFSKQGQKGFTLLELLIVVTIIAILSVGAILAYEGLTDQAQSATAANNTASADQAIRNYVGVTGNYPNQWDLLVAADGATGADLAFVADETYQVLAKLPTGAMSATLTDQIVASFEEVGIDELQARTVATAAPGVEPNLQHSEGATAADGNTIEVEMDDVGLPGNLVVIPTANSGALCTVGGVSPAEIRLNDADGDPITSNVDDPDVAQAYMTTVNDNIGEDECHFVVALGFGHDAAHSTVNSNVAIAAAPAFVSNNIKPADNYARYIALFDMGVDANGNGDIEAGEIRPKPKMIGLIDPEGRVIDQNVAAANDANAND